MKEKDFYVIIDKVLVECIEIMKSKGIAYSGRDDKFGNFKRVAKNLCMEPEQVWYVYFAKHLDSLSAWLRGDYVDSEPIEGRIKDLINYLLLLYGMIEESRREAEKGGFTVPSTVEAGCCTEDSGDMLPVFNPDEIVDPTERMLAKEDFDEKIGK